jgi:hypothetical protein
MDTDISHAEDLSERRFRTLFFVLRLGGVPCNMKNISIINDIYNGVAVVCICVTYFSVIMDTIVSRHNLGETMNSVRLAYAFGLTVWMSFSARFVSSKSIVM